MLRTKLNISRYDFDKIEYDKNDESEIILYLTTGGKDLPEVKIKCIIEKSLFVKDIRECSRIGTQFDKFLKDQIEKELEIKEIENYILVLDGFISGMENVKIEGSEESEDYILFNVSDASTFADGFCHHRLV